MKKVVATGKTIEEAVKAGLSELKTTEDRVKINVIEQPAKGLFGLLGSKEAKVELELIPNPVEEAVHFLNEMFASMDAEVRTEVQTDAETITINLIGDDMGILIGRRGQTLDSLQYLVNIVANKYSNKHVRIVLDAENFRDRRKHTLEELADRLAQRVTRSRKEVVLEPMSPLERKIIHSRLQEHPKVKTLSKGEEPNRRVVISPK